MTLKYILIGVGGAVGSVLRYAMQGWVQRAVRTTFPAGQVGKLAGKVRRPGLECGGADVSVEFYGREGLGRVGEYERAHQSAVLLMVV